MAKAKFEIYEGLTKRKKKYVVTDIHTNYSEIMIFCKKLFKCSEEYVFCETGYIYKGELYLDDPEMPGAKLVCVAYYFNPRIVF